MITLLYSMTNRVILKIEISNVFPQNTNHVSSFVLKVNRIYDYLEKYKVQFIVKFVTSILLF